MIIIEGNGEDAASVKKMFLKGDEASGGVSKDPHTLDSQDHFVGIEVDVLIEWKFSIKDETKILPSVFGLQN